MFVTAGARAGLSRVKMCNRRLRRVSPGGPRTRACARHRVVPTLRFVVGFSRATTPCSGSPMRNVSFIGRRHPLLGGTVQWFAARAGALCESHERYKVSVREEPGPYPVITRDPINFSSATGADPDIPSFLAPRVKYREIRPTNSLSDKPTRPPPSSGGFWHSDMPDGPAGSSHIPRRRPITRARRLRINV
jgi:hypothetical protein